MRFQLFTLAAVLIGCGSDPLSPSTETLVIGPTRMTCQGFIEQECLMTKNEETGAWEFFYEEIEGFTHIPGFIYTLEVELRDRGTEIQDVGRYSYHLVKVKSKEPVEDDFKYF